jgi:hypothetical protein
MNMLYNGHFLLAIAFLVFASALAVFHWRRR